VTNADKIDFNMRTMNVNMHVKQLKIKNTTYNKTTPMQLTVKFV